MSLRAKTLSVIIGTLLGLLGLMYVAAQQILLAGFQRLEAQEMRQNVSQAQDALADDLEKLRTTAGDYAAWDDTYAFAAGENPTYVAVNLAPQTFINLNLNLVVIVNSAGEVVYGQAFDPILGELRPMPAGLQPYLTSSSPLLQLATEAASVVGLLLVGEDTLLIAARPILTSDYTGPMGGALIMGRYLDNVEVDRLAQVTHLAVQVARINHPTTPADVRAAQASISTNMPILVQPLNADRVAGYAQLYDLEGRPILMLRVEESRAIYAEGRRSITFFLGSLLLAGLVFGFLIWALLERLVLARLAHLSKSVQAIGAQSDDTARVTVEGHDELANVAIAINGMLATQAQANATMRAGETMRASEAKFRKLAETSAAAIFIVQDARVRYANSHAATLTGYSHSELVNMPLEAILPLELQSTGLGPAASDFRAGENQRGRYEVRIVSPRGQARWLDVTAAPTDYEGQAATIATAYDISERKQAEEELHTANQQLMTLVAQFERLNRENSLLARMSDMLQACPTAEESYSVIARFLQQLPALASALYLYRASRDKLEAVATAGAIPFAAGESVFLPDDCWALRLGRMHTAGGPEAGLVCAHLAKAPPGGYMCVPIMAGGNALGVLHLRFDAVGPAAADRVAIEQADRLRLVEAVGERLALALANLNLREALRHQAVRDPLTGLFNRRYMQETLERELSRATRSQSAVTVLFLDIDHFKSFNDTHGHGTGDALLREVGRVLRTSLRADDVACRYGGEEFLLILPDTPLAVAQQRAESVRNAVGALRVQDSDRMMGAVTLSVGVAAFPDHGATGELLIHAADQALYQAKQTGRDRVCVATT